MACLLQPKCNFLQGFFRCKLPVEVVDGEVKITSMQGMHIFRRDQTTQLIMCTPWNTRPCSHPTIIKKMKTFLKVEGKMGQIPDSQFRPPLPDTNPNIRKDNAAEKRKRAMPKRIRLATPKSTTMDLPLPEVPPKPKLMYQIANLHLQFQFVKALNGLVQAKCQATYLKIGTGCSHQTICTMPMKIELKMST